MRPDKPLFAEDLPESLRSTNLNRNVTGFRDNEFLDFDVNPTGSKLAEN